MKSARLFVIAGIVLLGICLQGHVAPVAAPDYQIFVDQRDRQSYNIVRIGDQWWFVENLNYAAEGSFKPEDESMGRMYSYETAETIMRLIRFAGRYCLKGIIFLPNQA